LLLLGISACPVLSQGAAADKTLDDHISQLLSNTTLEEKAAQMQDQAPAIPRLGIPARLGIHLGACYACEDRVTYRLLLDGKVLLDSQHLAAGADRDNASVPLELADSSAHRLVVEYTHREAGGQVDIVWDPAGRSAPQ
jgi:hypothetical protein